MTELDRALLAAAHAPELLVACDFDGTLAPIVDNPADAQPGREAMVALRSMAVMPHTHAAIISGRALSELARLTSSPGGIHLVGSHGGEFDPGFATALPAEAVTLRQRLLDELHEIARGVNGVGIEAKPAGAAFHYRNADPADAQRSRDSILNGPATWAGVHIRHGKLVVELSVVPTSKGAALQTLRQRLGAAVVIFVGDDVTDEDAFQTLRGPDIGIKVGPEPSAARFRVNSPAEVTRTLARLFELRDQWVGGARFTPIEDHALLSDQRALALVTPDARVVWMCTPRIDGRAIFSALLGGPTEGSFDIGAPDEAPPIGQEYVDETFTLRTRWPCFTVTDYLDCTGGRAYQRAGRTDLVRVIEGEGRVRIRFAPRLDFSRGRTRLIASSGGLEVDAAPDPIVLVAPFISWTITDEGHHHTAEATIDLTPGRPVVLELRLGTHSLTPSIISEPRRREDTHAMWSNWVATLRLPHTHTDLARRSALVLRALCYGPTGAIAAAATTSLPETIGGVRNWDYRYCWVRDAAMAGSSLVQLGNTGIAMKFLDWLLGVVDRAESPDRLRPLYTVTGSELGPEAEIAELPGYRASRPVRIGNAASEQVQLDVFGPIVELVAMLAESGAAVSPDHWRLVRSMVQAVESRWHEPDHGIWEVRLERRHHVHSKVMCWMTVDRALRLALLYQGREPEGWTALREAIKADILLNGWSDEVGSFTTAYGDTSLDAAALWVGLSGLLAPDDPRFTSTVDAVERELREGPTVYRYRCDDGLPGGEGGFNICTTWLIESLAMIGRVTEARELLDAYAQLAGPTGLLPEEFCPRTGDALGNHPQAYSHLGFINAALRLDAASVQ